MSSVILLFLACPYSLHLPQNLGDGVRSGGKAAIANPDFFVQKRASFSFRQRTPRPTASRPDETTTTNSQGDLSTRFVNSFPATSAESSSFHRVISYNQVFTLRQIFAPKA